MQLQLQNNVELVWIKCLTVKISDMATIKIKQVRSAIKRPADQKATIKALGFRKLNQVIEKEDTPQILGMIKKVQHLLIVVE
jgi:large subunit ribosomal protein L30